MRKIPDSISLDHPRPIARTTYANIAAYRKAKADFWAARRAALSDPYAKVKP